MKRKSKICSHCGEEFARPIYLTNHIARLHSAVVKNIVCPICVIEGKKDPQTCSTVSNLKTHIQRQHKAYKGRLQRLNVIIYKYVQIMMFFVQPTKVAKKLRTEDLMEKNYNIKMSRIRTMAM